MSLTVLVKSASNLPNVEKFGKSDPMCVISLQGQLLCSLSGPCNVVLGFITGEKKKTKVIDNNLDPEWNEVNFVCFACVEGNHYMFLIRPSLGHFKPRSQAQSRWRLKYTTMRSCAVTGALSLVEK